MLGNLDSRDSERNTEFPTGNLSDFLNDFSKEKQEMEIDQEEILRDVPETEEEANEEESTFVDSFTSLQASEMLVGILDTVAPAGLALLSKTEVKDWQAEPEQRTTLKHGFKSYLDAKGLDLPPGWLLLFLVLSIYGVKVPSALALRKEHNELKEVEKRERLERMNEKKENKKETTDATV